ncbi:NCS2 family permease [bacterium]|nr:NCS2 family permease [bacterium]RQV94372.1 MAG: NCS2 family permease [bacterium]
MLEKLFKLQEKGTTIRIEVIGGITTFMTMAYIIFVNPAILSVDFAGNPTGLSLEAAMLATCLAAFVATTLMGLYANFPIAQAPGMGENFFFVSVVMTLTAMGVADSWKVTLSITLIAGLIFLILSLLKFRKAIIDAVSPSLKNGIAVGIGLLIAFIGFQNGQVILGSEGTLVQFNTNLLQAEPIIFFFGLFFTAALFVRHVRGAIIWGILLTTLISIIAGKVQYSGIIGLPQDHAFFRFDLIGALKVTCIPFIVVFLFMDMFDTVGTLIGVGEQMGIMEDNKLPGANRALISDAVGTVVGSCTGTSTVTSFIESVVGVQYGARTGLASVITGLLFLVALFFTPIVGMVGRYLPITAPALVIVGAMMVRNVHKIDWEDYSEAIPAFLMILGIPLSYNIHDGLAMGFIAYPVIKLLAGRGKEINWLIGLVAVLFILRYVLVKI